MNLLKNFVGFKMTTEQEQNTIGGKEQTKKDVIVLDLGTLDLL